MTQWRVVKPLEAAPARALVSFTFDDFPRSAALAGADILGRYGACGTYYACTGLLGGSGPSGAYPTEYDFRALSEAGHEIGAHSARHLDCARTPVRDVLADLERNAAHLKALLEPAPVAHFAYPFGETTPQLKHALTERFDTCRGVLPGINRAGSDAMQLRAVELNGAPGSLRRAQRMVEALAARPGWLIFFTHDVAAAPSPFGITPSGLERLVRQASDSGAALVTVSEAWQRVSAGRPS
ncbi:MAG: polysaccharide deacetylase family protein [Pseudomonadota bacterium]